MTREEIASYVTGHVKQALAARDAAEGEADEGADLQDLFFSCIVAVADGICREMGPNMRPDEFDPFGSELTAAAFLFLRDARMKYEGHERALYVSAFLGSVAGTVAKLGIRSSRGRVIPTARLAAEYTIGLVTTGQNQIRQAQIEVQRQQQAQAQMNAQAQSRGPFGQVAPVAGTVEQRTNDLLRVLGG